MGGSISTACRRARRASGAWTVCDSSRSPAARRWSFQPGSSCAIGWATIGPQATRAPRRLGPPSRTRCDRRGSTRMRSERIRRPAKYCSQNSPKCRSPSRRALISPSPSRPRALDAPTRMSPTRSSSRSSRAAAKCSSRRSRSPRGSRRSPPATRPEPLRRATTSKAPDFASIVAATLGGRVVVNENGRRKRITKLEAAIKQLVNRAAGGEARSIQLLIALVQAGEARPSQADPTEASQADANVLRELQRRLAEQA